MIDATLDTLAPRSTASMMDSKETNDNQARQMQSDSGSSIQSRSNSPRALQALARSASGASSIASSDMEPSSTMEDIHDSEVKAEHGKAKRKRTSAKDQAILEAEYKRNPKPNKAARAEIVQRVELGEKAVQIWYQNRRQIDRRKSRPLLPHEMAAFGLGGSSALLDLSQSPFTLSAPSSQEMSSSSQDDVAFSQKQQASLIEPQEEQIASSQESTEATLAPYEQGRGPIGEAAELSTPVSNPVSISAPASANEGTSQSFQSTPGYLSNRWNPIHRSSVSLPHIATAIGTPTMAQSCKEIFGPASCPERIGDAQLFQMRLSLSLDGKATLVSGDSPSPPETLLPRPASSVSTYPMTSQERKEQRRDPLSTGLFPQKEVSASPTIPYLQRGRSRDLRNWELCCDPEAREELNAQVSLGVTRDELTMQAENEAKGSAVAAISLLRSSSGSMLHSNSNKRNSPALTRAETTGSKRVRVSKSGSLSYVQVQRGKENAGSIDSEKSTITEGKIRKRYPNVADKKLKRMVEKAATFQILSTSTKSVDGPTSPSGDSDKENVAPGDLAANRPRRRALPSAPATKGNDEKHVRSVLGENRNILSLADFEDDMRSGRNKRQKNGAVASHAVYEDPEEAEAGLGEDVEKFMRGEVSPSKKGDLDCIQGLLSLSQGNWR